MKNLIILLAVAALLGLAPVSIAEQDERQFVQLPPMMQTHMLANMRDHLRTLNAILAALAEGDGGAAARLAEQRLGMSSLQRHGASHMARFMPDDMARLGTGMHRAASRFALRAQEADVDNAQSAYAALQEVTAACVACHDAYRIR